MKIKSIPSDFRVIEKVSLEIGSDGGFFAFEMEKEALTTSEALDRISSASKVRRSSWRAAGLKDKHALTRQFVTIPAGEWRGAEPKEGESFEFGGSKLFFSGRTAEAIRRGHICANEFRVTIRDLTRARVTRMLNEWDSLVAGGMPNYFDSQRFGSSRHGQGFAFSALLRGEGEEAIRLLLVPVARKDRKSVKERRRAVRAVWGDWEKIAAIFPRSAERAVAQHLAENPADYAGAFEAFERGSAVPYNVLAFQSMLFNLMMAAAIRESGAPAFDFSLAGMGLSFATKRPDDFSDDFLLPLARPGREFDECWEPHFRRACAAMGVEADSVQAPVVARNLWDRSARRLWVDVAQTTGPQVKKDDLYAARRALTVSFELPAASYATLAIKRLQHAARAIS